MTHTLTLLIIAKNEEKLLDDCIRSCGDLVTRIVIIDNNSKDKTQLIAQRHGAYIKKSNNRNLGKLRSLGLKSVQTDWVLVLDADERVTPALSNEIKQLLQKPKHSAYHVPFQNHLFGKPLFHGGETYKMLRLFKKEAVNVKQTYVHEAYIPKTGVKTGVLTNPVIHYSYQSPRQMITKFHKYALREAKQKFNDGEHSSVKKILLYPPHMFWARFIKDKGYKDGPVRILLDGGFAYMELVTYIALAYYNMKRYI